MQDVSSNPTVHQVTPAPIGGFIPVQSHVDTATAACMLGLKINTLQKWHSTGQGPLKPTRLGNRLRWAVADIQAVLSGSK